MTDEQGSQRIGLTIYIPTYQRIAQLESLVSLIDCELAIFHDCTQKNPLGIVEILISGNEPADIGRITSSIQELRHQGVFRVVSPRKTINGNENIAAGSSLARYQYIWILCDDDIPCRGAIVTLYKLLSDLRPSLLYLEPRIKHITEADNYITSNGMINKDLINSIYLDSDILDRHSRLNSIDPSWLKLYTLKLLRASSLVYNRYTTHKLWQTSSYAMSSNVLSLALALDAIEGGNAVEVVDPVYNYIESRENKQSWASQWLLIQFLQAYPLSNKFLKDHEIIHHPQHDTLAFKQILVLYKLICRYPEYLRLATAREAVCRYTFNWVKRVAAILFFTFFKKIRLFPKL
jgi:hypothetical protein